MQYAVSRLPNVCLVLITPDSSEIRWVSAVPKPGMRIPGRFPGAWLVVDEVLRSGVVTHTVFGSTASEGLIDQARDLAADAVERMQESLSPTDDATFPRPERTGTPPPVAVILCVGHGR
jgi:hypothetical protein